MIRLYGLLFLINLALLVVALIDCLSSEEYAVRNLPKVAWAFIILLFSPVGPIVWFVAGRPQKHQVGRGGAWRPGSGFPEAERPGRGSPEAERPGRGSPEAERPGRGSPEAERPRPVAPDDDPEFLQSIRRDDERLLNEWEADLRRREEELRRRDGRDEPS